MKIINEMTLMRVHGFIERTYAISDGRYAVITFNKGYRRGYIAVPMTHPLARIDVIDLPREIPVNYAGTRSNFYKVLELTEHKWFFRHSWNAEVDVETLHKCGVPGFKGKRNQYDPVTLETAIEKLHNLSAQLTPQAIMEHKMRKINNQN